MAIVELEFTRQKFAALVEFVISLAPIPVPTLPVLLGPDRLISSLHWENVNADAAFSDFHASPGTVFCSASLSIWHVSIEELRLNAGALGSKIDTIAGLLVRATPTGLVVDLVALSTGNNHRSLSRPFELPASLFLSLTAHRLC